MWRSGQVTCGNFIVASANLAALVDSVHLAWAANLEAANKAGGESPLGARVGALVAVIAASKRPVTKEDWRQVPDQLTDSVTDWRAVDSPVKAVQDAIRLVRRSRRLMARAGWTSNYSELEEIQRILLGDALGRRSPSWERHGSILAKWIRTQ